MFVDIITMYSQQQNKMNSDSKYYNNVCENYE